MQWVASTLHTTSEHGVSSITTADAHNSAASTELTPPGRFKWTRPLRQKTKSGFCACAITFQTLCTTVNSKYVDAKRVGNSKWDMERIKIILMQVSIWLRLVYVFSRASNVEVSWTSKVVFCNAVLKLWQTDKIWWEISCETGNIDGGRGGAQRVALGRFPCTSTFSMQQQWYKGQIRY